jgi:hypothetical protein
MLTEQTKKEKTSKEFLDEIDYYDKHLMKLLNLPVISEEDHYLIEAGLKEFPKSEEASLIMGFGNLSPCYYGYQRKYPPTFDIHFPLALNEAGRRHSTVRTLNRDGWEYTMTKEEQTRLKNLQREYLRLRKQEGPKTFKPKMKGF